MAMGCSNELRHYHQLFSFSFSFSFSVLFSHVLQTLANSGPRTHTGKQLIPCLLDLVCWYEAKIRRLHGKLHVLERLPVVSDTVGSGRPRIGMEVALSIGRLEEKGREKKNGARAEKEQNRQYEP